jgi:hypothetical protein
MAELDGSFELHGREFTYEVLSVETTEGTTYTGADMEDYLGEADRIFYVARSGDDDYYRWVAGPYESMDDVQAAIEDEIGEYE